MLCIRKYRKIHIPISESDDSCLCQSCCKEDNTDYREDEMSQVEENTDDFENDANELYTLVIQK
jgi:hypothetical protein